METDKTIKPSFMNSEEKPEGKIIREFCRDGECEIKMYQNRRYMRKKKKIS